MFSKLIYSFYAVSFGAIKTIHGGFLVIEHFSFLFIYFFFFLTSIHFTYQNYSISSINLLPNIILYYYLISFIIN